MNVVPAADSPSDLLKNLRAASNPIPLLPTVLRAYFSAEQQWRQLKALMFGAAILAFAAWWIWDALRPGGLRGLIPVGVSIALLSPLPLVWTRLVPIPELWLLIHGDIVWVHAMDVRVMRGSQQLYVREDVRYASDHGLDASFDARLTGSSREEVLRAVLTLHPHARTGYDANLMSRWRAQPASLRSGGTPRPTGLAHTWFRYHKLTPWLTVIAAVLSTFLILPIVVRFSVADSALEAPPSVVALAPPTFSEITMDRHHLSFTVATRPYAVVTVTRLGVSQSAGDSGTVRFDLDGPDFSVLFVVLPGETRSLEVEAYDTVTYERVTAPLPLPMSIAEAQAL